MSGGENGWAQKLLGGTKPEATPRAGAADSNALDRRSSQEQQQRLYRQRGEAEDEEGEEEEGLHSLFGTKIQPARHTLTHLVMLIYELIY